LLIRLEDIKDEGLELEFEEPRSSFPLLADLQADEVVFLEPVRVRLKIFRAGDMVEAQGEVSSSVRVACGRCLKEFHQPIHSAFELTYVEELPEIEDESADGDLELDAEDMGLILVEGEEIDFAGVIEEQVLMALPLRPLCDEGCKGLCPQCGTDLNVSRCGCPPSEFGGKFAVLKNFKIDKS